ncbi:MAG: iron-sulfur cluster insertion protein ErpA [Proteobacteria bacterium]|nr:iron-sulfur cluster insertion protein ErpA [Pseudomonadota bacterium]MDA1059336.1 iron-sulfur cluster insertion protein ErpA [Pseudomonadota bacterium]
MAEAPTMLSLSESAEKRVSFLMTQEDNPNVMLRVVVNGGGCAGFQYGFSFDDSKTDDDVLIEQGDVKVVTDNMSLMYLAGAQIDFVEDMIGAAFSIKNPNAASTCSCGTSFSVA